MVKVSLTGQNFHNGILQLPKAMKDSFVTDQFAIIAKKSFHGKLVKFLRNFFGAISGGKWDPTHTRLDKVVEAAYKACEIQAKTQALKDDELTAATQFMEGLRDKISKKKTKNQSISTAKQTAVKNIDNLIGKLQVLPSNRQNNGTVNVTVPEPISDNGALTHPNLPNQPLANDNPDGPVLISAEAPSAPPLNPPPVKPPKPNSVKPKVPPKPESSESNPTGKINHKSIADMKANLKKSDPNLKKTEPLKKSDTTSELQDRLAKQRQKIEVPK